ncbi:MAG TPA: hypothetical protein VFT96_11210 [Gemmatimonadaceae bacterium]|nr:hypothetical protein [Gemmatimonadaceae bacterium]
MRRSVLLVLGLTASAAVFSACRDAAVAPAERAGTPVDLQVPPVQFDELAEQPKGVTYTVTLDPARDIRYSDGVNSISIPAGSICDPASSYGPAYWDAPCAPATAPITLAVTLSRANGGIIVHFGRDLRFAPTTDPSKQVTLVAEVPSVASATASAAAYAILWVPTGSTSFVDEGATDPSLATVVDRSSGRLLRRLKHFSGYYVNLGYQAQCDPNTGENCTGGN